MDYIGYEFAKERGFSIHHYSGDRSHISYVNVDGIFMDIIKDQYDENQLLCKLSFVASLPVLVTTDYFSIPNKNFDIFLKKIYDVYYGRLGN